MVNIEVAVDLEVEVEVVIKIDLAVAVDVEVDAETWAPEAWDFPSLSGMSDLENDPVRKPWAWA